VEGPERGGLLSVEKGGLTRKKDAGLRDEMVGKKGKKNAKQFKLLSEEVWIERRAKANLKKSVFDFYFKKKSVRKELCNGKCTRRGSPITW